MSVGVRYLAALAVAAAIGAGFTVPATAVAQELPSAPALCTPEQERSGDQDVIQGCLTKRIDSAKARYEGIPLEEGEKTPETYQMRADVGVAPADPKDGTDVAAYRAWATEASAATCRMVARNGGSLCTKDFKGCVKAVYEDYCVLVAGGSPTDGQTHDDESLSMVLSEAKRTAAAADKAAAAGDTVDHRIAANEAETEAAAAAREAGWIS